MESVPEPSELTPEMQEFISAFKAKLSLEDEKKKEEAKIVRAAR